MAKLLCAIGGGRGMSTAKFGSENTGGRTTTVVSTLQNFIGNYPEESWWNNNGTSDIGMRSPTEQFDDSKANTGKQESEVHGNICLEVGYARVQTSGVTTVLALGSTTAESIVFRVDLVTDPASGQLRQLCLCASNSTLDQVANFPPLVDGVPVNLIVRQRQGSGINAADGLAQLWVNGTLAAEHTGDHWLTTTGSLNGAFGDLIPARQRGTGKIFGRDLVLWDGWTSTATAAPSPLFVLDDRVTSHTGTDWTFFASQLYDGQYNGAMQVSTANAETTLLHVTPAFLTGRPVVGYQGYMASRAPTRPQAVVATVVLDDQEFPFSSADTSVIQNTNWIGTSSGMKDISKCFVKLKTQAAGANTVYEYRQQFVVAVSAMSLGATQGATVVTAPAVYLRSPVIPIF